jgi:hypothetical protein
LHFFRSFNIAENEKYKYKLEIGVWYAEGVTINEN